MYISTDLINISNDNHDTISPLLTQGSDLEESNRNFVKPLYWLIPKMINTQRSVYFYILCVSKCVLCVRVSYDYLIKYLRYLTKYFGVWYSTLPVVFFFCTTLHNFMALERLKIGDILENPDADEFYLYQAESLIAYLGH